MKNLARLHEEARRRLRREKLSAATICLALAALGALTATHNLPALNSGVRGSGFLGGFLMGLFCVAGVVTIRRIVNLRHALADDQALRNLYAKEHDELQAHMEREIARTFVQIIPALAVVAIFAGSLVSFEAMIAVAATLVFLSLALLVIKVSHTTRYRSDTDESTY